MNSSTLTGSALAWGAMFNVIPSAKRQKSDDAVPNESLPDDVERILRVVFLLDITGHAPFYK